MEQSSKKRKLQKRDVLFLSIVLFIGILLLGYYVIGYQKPGDQVEITVDGEHFGTYSLLEEQEIWIPGVNKGENLLVISKGKADMTDANCPDQLCVKHHMIANTGESITCLPNKVVVTVIGDAQPELDAIVK